MLRSIGYSIIRLILLIRNYGAVIGTSLWIQIALQRGSITLRSKLFRNSIRLRSKDSDLDIFNQVFVELQYQWKDIELLQPRVIMDAGANIGLAALYFARLFPDARICCVEPDAANFTLLQFNTRSYPNIQHIQAAVWYRHEALDFSNKEGFSAGLQVRPAQQNNTIQGRTIPELMQHFGIDFIDILKMDVEGAEKEIFGSGDTGWLQQVGILVIELHDMYREGTAVAFFEAVQGKFERIYFQGENLICFLHRS
jgi:FkbM family methyltransferase